jgi:hypothetical protein
VGALRHRFEEALHQGGRRVGGLPGLERGDDVGEERLVALEEAVDLVIERGVEVGAEAIDASVGGEAGELEAEDGVAAALGGGAPGDGEVAEELVEVGASSTS